VFTSNALIQCTTSIEIGRRCLVGQSAMIVDGSHRFRDPHVPIVAQGYDYRPIHIGDDVAIMAKCTVIADIGQGAFIGANSVVTRPIPPHSLAIGSPARVIEHYGPDQPEADGLDG
jgi:acetyltransferase-like isoleucine patch superfamily enzyme